MRSVHRDQRRSPRPRGARGPFGHRRRAIPAAPRARRHLNSTADARARRDHRRGRVAIDPARPALLVRKPPVDRHCVHAHVRRASAPRRSSRRRARSTAHVRVRAGRVFSGLVGRRLRHDLWLVDRGPRRARRRGRSGSADGVGAHRRHLRGGPRTHSRDGRSTHRCRAQAEPSGCCSAGSSPSSASWRWVLFVNVPIGALVVIAAPRVLERSAPRGGKLDIPGALLATAGMTALVYGLVSAPARGWADPITVTCLAGSARAARRVRSDGSTKRSPDAPPSVCSATATGVPATS